MGYITNSQYDQLPSVKTTAGVFYTKLKNTSSWLLTNTRI